MQIEATPVSNLEEVAEAVSNPSIWSNPEWIVAFFAGLAFATSLISIVMNWRSESSRRKWEFEQLTREQEYQRDLQKEQRDWQQQAEKEAREYGELYRTYAEVGAWCFYRNTTIGNVLGEIFRGTPVESLVELLVPLNGQARISSTLFNKGLAPIYVGHLSLALYFEMPDAPLEEEIPEYFYPLRNPKIISTHATNELPPGHAITASTDLDGLFSQLNNAPQIVEEGLDPTIDIPVWILFKWEMAVGEPWIACAKGAVSKHEVNMAIRRRRVRRWRK